MQTSPTSQKLKKFKARIRNERWIRENIYGKGLTTAAADTEKPTAARKK